MTGHMASALGCLVVSLLAPSVALLPVALAGLFVCLLRLQLSASIIASRLFCLTACSPVLHELGRIRPVSVVDRSWAVVAWFRSFLLLYTCLRRWVEPSVGSL